MKELKILKVKDNDYLFDFMINKIMIIILNPF